MVRQSVDNVAHDFPFVKPAVLARCKLPLMTTITFDTFKFVDRLEKAGATRDLAVAIADAQQEAFAQALDTTLATKSDIVRLENKISLLDAKVDAKFDKLSWMLAAVLALAAANFAKQYL